jgi:hypothetical protein
VTSQPASNQGKAKDVGQAAAAPAGNFIRAQVESILPPAVMRRVAGRAIRTSPRRPGGTDSSST